MKTSLSDLAIGNEGIIIENNSKEMRLLDIGLTEKTKVKCLLKNRSLKAYLIRGSVIAIRKEDLEGILVCPIK